MSDAKDPIILDGRYVESSQKLTPKKDIQTNIIELEKPFSCDFCNKRFGTKQNLSVHLRVHAGEKPHECEECHKKFSRKCQLENHYKNMHITIDTNQNQVEPLSDVTLTKKQIDLSKLNEHEHEYPCTMCEKKFPSSVSLSIHLRVHTKEKPFECQLCLKKFSQLGNLKTHSLIHINKKPYKCNICNKSFIQKGNLQTHYKTHTNEKPFQCSACNKKFTQKGNLLSHERSQHFTEKPYECNVCHVTFATKFYFQKHSQVHISDASTKDSAIETPASIKTLNNNKLPVVSSYECTVCHATFGEKQALNLHVQIHTNIVASKLNQISCKEATNDVDNTSNGDSNDTSLSQPSDPCVANIGENASKVNTSQPNNESRSLDSQSSGSTENKQLPSELSNSICDTIDYKIDTNDNSFICGKCYKSFSGKPSFMIHYRIHTGSQLFKLGICDKKFNQKQTLMYHKRTHTGKRPYKCDYCAKSFAKKQNLLVHLRIHTDKRQYQCEECPKRFTQKPALRYVKSTHGNGKQNIGLDNIQRRLVGVSAASYNKFKQKLVLRRQHGSQTWEVSNVPECISNN